MRAPHFTLLTLIVIFIPCSAKAASMDTGTGISRSAFVAMAVKEALPKAQYDTCLQTITDNARYTQLFADVSRTSPDAPALCVALQAGIIHGYEDGTFRPDQPINVAEAAKVLARAFAKPTEPFPVMGSPWFASSARFLAAKGALPPAIVSFDQTVDSPLATTLIDRLAHGKGGPSISYEQIVKRNRGH